LVLEKKSKEPLIEKEAGKRSDASKWMSGSARLGFEPFNMKRKAPEGEKVREISPRALKARPEAATQND
jgi:hypothetical protein